MRVAGWPALSKNPIAPKDATVLVAVGLFIQGSQSLHDIVKANWRSLLACAKTGCGFYGTAIRCPRRKNGPFLVKRKIRIPDHFRRVPECLGRMKQGIEAGVFLAVVHIPFSLRQIWLNSPDLNAPRFCFLHLWQLQCQNSVFHFRGDLILVDLVGEPEAAAVMADVVLGVERLESPVLAEV